MVKFIVEKQGDSPSSILDLNKPKKSKVHKHQDDLRPNNSNDKSVSSILSEKVNVLKKLAESIKNKEKYSSVSTAESMDTSCNLNASQNDTMLKSQVCETVISKKLTNSSKNKQKCDESSKVKFKNNTANSVKTKKRKHNYDSSCNIENENISSDHITSHKCNETKRSNTEGEVKRKCKKRKLEHDSSLGLHNQGDSLTKAVSKGTPKSELKDKMTVKHKSLKPKHAIQKPEMRKWYHECVDEEYFTSDDESASETETFQDRSLQRQHRQLSNERLTRTLFVGNLPPNINKKRLEKLFNRVLKKDEVAAASKCLVESIRFRGAIPVTGGTSKRARKLAAIKGEFSGVSKFRIGYVVLTSKIGIQAALTLNGCCLNSNGAVFNPEESTGDATDSTNQDCKYHIRVDCAIKNKTNYKPDNCVFLGNLPFDCTEEEIYNALSSLGSLASVRLIRDNQTGAVRGFGYATFTDPSYIPLAIRASNTLTVRGRPIRIFECKTKKPKKNKIKASYVHQSNSTDKKTPITTSYSTKNMKKKTKKTKEKKVKKREGKHKVKK
ncbi:unnamed protein product [Trichobilharzia szidati]|nr:unnamed protein product [Trichobilharzia szidati]